MNNDKPYFEGFFAVRFEIDGVRVVPISQEQYSAFENLVAEINIPLKGEDRDYCMIAMLVDLPNDYIALTEMVVLKTVVADVVRDHSDHFKRVG